MHTTQVSPHSSIAKLSRFWLSCFTPFGLLAKKRLNYFSLSNLEKKMSFYITSMNEEFPFLSRYFYSNMQNSNIRVYVFSVIPSHLWEMKLDPIETYYTNHGNRSIQKRKQHTMYLHNIQKSTHVYSALIDNSGLDGYNLYHTSHRDSFM